MNLINSDGALGLAQWFEAQANDHSSCHLCVSSNPTSGDDRHVTFIPSHRTDSGWFFFEFSGFLPPVDWTQPRD